MSSTIGSRPATLAPQRRTDAGVLTEPAAEVTGVAEAKAFCHRLHRFGEILQGGAGVGEQARLAPGADGAATVLMKDGSAFCAISSGYDTIDLIHRL